MLPDSVPAKEEPAIEESEDMRIFTIFQEIIAFWEDPKVVASTYEYYLFFPEAEVINTVASVEDGI